MKNPKRTRVATGIYIEPDLVAFIDAVQHGANPIA
jgi:hypothetical protein